MDEESCRGSPGEGTTNSTASWTNDRRNVVTLPSLFAAVSESEFLFWYAIASQGWNPTNDAEKQNQSKKKSW